MNLGEAGIGKKRPLFESAICRGDIAAARIRREIKNISVTAGREHHCVAGMRFDFSGDQTASDNSFGVTVHHHKVEHFGLRVHLHHPGRNLPTKRLVGAEQELLPCLPARVKRARYLSAPE